MIIIIRALSQWGKDDGDYDSPISRDETPDEKKEAKKKRKGPKKERKREKGQCYYPLTTLVLQSSTMIFMIESLSFRHFHILIALVHPLHGNPYSLTLISIDGHLHSPLIRLVDVRLSSPFCLLHNHHSIPPIVLYPWLTLMYCVKIEKVLKKLEYETIAWLVIRVVHDLSTLCGEDGA